MTLRDFGLCAEAFQQTSIPDEVANLNAQMAQMSKAMPDITELGVDKARRGGFMPKAPPCPDGIDREIGNGVSVRIIPVASPAAVYLHIHGGGLILGSADGQDPMLMQIANGANVTCVSVEYRLTPDHPYPAAWDDCEAAALWLIENAKAEFGTDRILIGGESAGALLSVTTLTRLRDHHDYTGIGAAALSFGVYDTGMTPSQRAAESGLLMAKSIAWIANCYAPDKTKHRDPEFSPLYADLADLPPALFTVGTADALLDDTLFMHARWLAAGNKADLAIYPGADHAFIGMPHPQAPFALQRIVQFLASHHSDGGEQ